MQTRATLDTLMAKRHNKNKKIKMPLRFYRRAKRGAPVRRHKFAGRIHFGRKANLVAARGVWVVGRSLTLDSLSPEVLQNGGLCSEFY